MMHLLWHTIYQKACSQSVMQQLEHNLSATISFSDKEEFYRVADLINGRTDADRMLIGWEMNSVWDRVRHRYIFMSLSRKKNRAISFIKKRLISFVADRPQ